MVKVIRKMVKDAGEGGEGRGQEVGHGCVLGVKQESEDVWGERTLEGVVLWKWRGWRGDEGTRWLTGCWRGRLWEAPEEGSSSSEWRAWVHLASWEMGGTLDHAVPTPPHGSSQNGLCVFWASIAVVIWTKPFSTKTESSIGLLSCLLKSHRLLGQ